MRDIGKLILEGQFFALRTLASVIKVGVTCVGVHVSRRLNEGLTSATDKRFQVISNIILFKSHTTKKLNNKAVLSVTNNVYVAMWSLVTYSNCLVIY